MEATALPYVKEGMEGKCKQVRGAERKVRRFNKSGRIGKAGRGRVPQVLAQVMEKWSEWPGQAGQWMNRAGGADG